VIVVTSLSFVLGVFVGTKETAVAGQQAESHENCHDSKTHEAWVAKKNGELRCFMEHKEYPHRAKGSQL
jgi:hypothetical protein